MARTNIPRTSNPVTTHEGGRASRITPEMELKRTLLTCLLWEDTFYESGEDVAARIKNLIPKCRPEFVRDLAKEARYAMKLRHAPLLVAREMVRYDGHRLLVSDLISQIIRRPDECGELLSLYWKGDKNKEQPLAAQIKKGISKAWNKFDTYQLVKYSGAARMQADITPIDVMFLCHPKPSDETTFGFDFINRSYKQGKNVYKGQVKRHTGGKGLLWKQLVEGTLPRDAVDIAERDDSKEGWERRIREGNVPAMNFIMNLRNMQNKGVDHDLIVQGFKSIDVRWVLPFRFITAAKVVPTFEPQLEESMFRCAASMPKFDGNNVLLVDVSGSMWGPLTEHKSEYDKRSTRRNTEPTRRIVVANALGMILREICPNLRVFTFSNQLIEVPARRGFSLSEVIENSQSHSSTYLARAINEINSKVKYDRMFVITDEQSHDGIAKPLSGSKPYLINVAPHRFGVGYDDWVHIHGWSENVLTYISAYERDILPNL